LAAFREAHRTTAALLAQAPDDPDRIFAHSQSEYWLGRIPYDRRNSAAARPAFERYKALVDRLIAIDPSNPTWIEESGYAEGSLCAIALEAPPDVTAARRHCFASLARILQVHRLRPHDLQVTLAVANHHAWAADVCNLLGRWDLVLAHRARQENLARMLLAREPNNFDFQDFWVSTQSTFADLLARHGQRLEARQWFERAAATAQRLHVRDPENVRWRDWAQRTAASVAALSAN
jgi:hypothetical protein